MYQTNSFVCPSIYSCNCPLYYPSIFYPTICPTIHPSTSMLNFELWLIDKLAPYCQFTPASSSSSGKPTLCQSIFANMQALTALSCAHQDCFSIVGPVWPCSCMSALLFDWWSSYDLFWHWSPELPWLPRVASASSGLLFRYWVLSRFAAVWQFVYCVLVFIKCFCCMTVLQVTTHHVSQPCISFRDSGNSLHWRCQDSL